MKSVHFRCVYKKELLFLIFVFALYLAFAIAQPFNSAPDENMRYQIADYIYHYGSLPHGGDPAIRDAQWGQSYAFNPILPYIISAVFMKIGSVFSTNFFFLVICARLVNVFCGVIAVYFCIKIAGEIFVRGYRWFFIVFCALLPEVVFIHSYVNCDSMAYLSTAIMIYAWVIGLQSRWSYKSCICLAVGVSLCALSYYNAYGFILCSVFLFLFSFVWLQRGTKYFKTLCVKALFVTVLVLLLSAWWFIRSGILYQGDIFGIKISNEYGELYAAPGFKPSERSTPAQLGQSFIYMLYQRKWLVFSFISFIAAFGYCSILLPSMWFYYIYLFVFFIGLLGAVWGVCYLRKMFKTSSLKKYVLLNITLFIAMIIPVIISLIFSYFSDFEPQGRYLLPSFIPIVYFTTFGFYHIMKKFIKSHRVQNVIIGVICVLYACVPLYCLFFLIIPIYHF